MRKADEGDREGHQATTIESKGKPQTSQKQKEPSNLNIYDDSGPFEDKGHQSNFKDSDFNKNQANYSTLRGRGRGARQTQNNQRKLNDEDEYVVKNKPPQSATEYPSNQVNSANQGSQSNRGGQAYTRGGKKANGNDNFHPGGNASNNTDYYQQSKTNHNSNQNPGRGDRGRGRGSGRGGTRSRGSRGANSNIQRTDGAPQEFHQQRHQNSGRGRGGRDYPPKTLAQDGQYPSQNTGSNFDKTNRPLKSHHQSSYVRGHEHDSKGEKELVVGVGSYKKKHQNKRSRGQPQPDEDNYNDAQEHQNNGHDHDHDHSNCKGHHHEKSNHLNHQHSKNSAKPEEEVGYISSPSDFNIKNDVNPPKFIWCECIICLVKVSPRQPIWNCVQCRTICHLKCIKDWIFKSNGIEEDKRRGVPPSKLMSWSCPHCKFEYTQTMPKYSCFCGKVRDPVSDIYMEPHSCGKRCGRIPHDNCTHPCKELCHSGQCPPCEIILPRTNCYCGKTVVQRKCQEFKALTCTNMCEKKLSCKKHSCDQKCHEGACKPCEEKVSVTCFCGRSEETELCGGAADISGGYECHRRCRKMLDCGYHECQETCHSGKCSPCKLKPIPNESCHCGKYKVSKLLGKEREDCQTSIPSCLKVCGKTMKCGHKCTLLCGDHDCDCGQFVKKPCRCTKSVYDVRCKDFDDDVMCQRVCNKKKNCGKCKCERICCDSGKSKQDLNRDLHHICFEICGKMLPCGKHPCPKRCHIGPCGDCTIMVNEFASCACGAQKIGPPIRCGQTAPWCTKECGKLLQCDHKCYSKCHSGTCPPCAELVDKPCKCGKTIRKNALCKEEYPCTNLCDKVLGCGHTCGQLCHRGDCNELVEAKRKKIIENGQRPPRNGCMRPCGLMRRVCGHPCKEVCSHYASCDFKPCEYQIKVECDCGNRTVFVDCGSTDTKVTKKIECDEKCRNLKRFQSLYAQSSKKQEYYPKSLVKFARQYNQFLRKQEVTLKDFLIGNDTSLRFSIPKSNPEKKQALLVLVTKHYNLDVYFFKSDTHFILTCSKNESSRPPQMLLSQYYEKILSQEIKVEDLPFEATYKFFNLSSHESCRELDLILGDLKEHCYSEKIGPAIFLNLWSKQYVQGVTKKLERSMGNFSNYHLEIKEDEPTTNPDDENQVQVIVTQEGNAESKDSIWDQIDLAEVQQDVSDGQKQPEADVDAGVTDIGEYQTAESDKPHKEVKSETILETNIPNLGEEDDLVAPNHDSANIQPVKFKVKESHDDSDYESSEYEQEITAKDVLNQMQDMARDSASEAEDGDDEAKTQ